VIYRPSYGWKATVSAIAFRPLGTLTVSGANHYQTVRPGEWLRNQSVGYALNGSAIPVKRLEYLFRLSLLGTVMGH
jgi:hypothetical protein